MAEERILQESFYARPTGKVALELLGKIICRRLPEGTLRGMIVETEAYFGEGDIASHASRGPTPRSKVMFGEPGRAYVYFTYGMHYLFNAVTEKDGKAGAVLVRAVEPLEGVDIMLKNRGIDKIRQATNGPAKFAEAFGIDLKENRCDLTTSESGLYIIDKGIRIKQAGRSPRVGVPLSNNDLFRYYIEENEYVSCQRRAANS